MALANPLTVADFADLFKVQDVEFVQNFNQQSSMTGGGERRYADRAPAMLRAKITTIPMLNAEAEGIMALINSRSGGLKSVLLYNYRLPYPSSDPNGNWLATGSNLPIGGQSLSYDFTAGTYEVDGAVTSEGAALSCTRASSAYALDSDGVWQSFANNEPRLTDLGLLVEPSRTNILTRSNDPSNSIWANKENITVGTTVDGWTPIRETTANNFHRLFRANTTSVVGVHTHTYWIKKAGRRYIGARVTLNGGTAYVNIGFDLDAVTTTRVPSGFSALIEKFGDVYRLVWSYTSSSTTIAGGLFTANVAITNDTLLQFAGDTGQGFDLFNAQIEAAADGTSPIITTSASVTRSADACSIHLPPGTHDLAVLRDDGPVSLTGRSVSYSLPNTQSVLIETVIGTKTSLTPGSAASPKVGTITDRLHVAFTDFPAGYEIPLGTWFGIIFDTSRYYLGQFAESRTADGSGAVASVEITPPLPASVTSGAAVAVSKPPAKFKMVPNSAFPSKVDGMNSTIEFSAEQTYGA